MKQSVSFKNDILFKYCVGQNSPDSLACRKFLFESITPYTLLDYRVDNPELYVIDKNDKQIVKDILMLHDNLRAGLEMQNTSVNRYLLMRFQYYAFRDIVLQMIGERDYGKVREYIQIVVINDARKDHRLILHSTLRYEDGNMMESCVIHLYFLNLKAIDRIAEEKDVLSEFEALAYLMRHDTLEGIVYEEEKGVIKIMEERKQRMTSDKGLMALMLTKEEEEKLKRMELEYAKEDAREEGHAEGHAEGHSQGRLEECLAFTKEIVSSIYHVSDLTWLDTKNYQELKTIAQLALTRKYSYTDLLKNVYKAKKMSH